MVKYCIYRNSIYKWVRLRDELFFGKNIFKKHRTSILKAMMFKNKTQSGEFTLFYYLIPAHSQAYIFLFFKE
jgi:hypothetical protein